MSRKKHTNGSDILPGDTLWRDGPGSRIMFRKRWPADIVRRFPELKHRPFQKALGTSDPKAARPFAAAALLAFQQEVERYRAPSTEDRRNSWLAGLTENQRRKLVEMVDVELGRERRTVYPPGSAFLPDDVEVWEGRHDSPSVILPDHPEHPSGNPFLSQQWPTEEAIATTPARAIARALEAIEATSRAIASPVQNRPHRARNFDADGRAELPRRLGYLVEALGTLSLPQEAFPDALSQVSEALPTDAKPSRAKHFTLADALAIRTRDLKEDRYKDQIEWALKVFPRDACGRTLL